MPQSIRILHVVDSLGKGGLENGLANLIERLSSRRFEHAVCAIRALGPNAERMRAAGARIVLLEKQRGARSHVGALARAIREMAPDVVHSRNWGAIEAVPAARWAGCRGVVHSEHGLEANTAGTEPWRRRCFRRLSFHLAHRVLSVSEQLRDVHARRTGFPAGRITVIHNGVDTDRFRPQAALRAEARAQLGVEEGAFCIGCVGNLSPAKDYPTALAGMRALDEAGVDWRLVILGEGPERPKLEATVSSMPAWKRRVSFLGLSNRVPELLAAMDVYLLSSVIEGISNSLLEAMASGLPIVATSVGGNPEVVVDGESGLLFPAGDAEGLGKRLLSLKSDSKEARRLAEGARRRVRENFSMESMVHKYEEIYEGLTAAAMAHAAVTA